MVFPAAASYAAATPAKVNIRKNIATVLVFILVLNSVYSLAKSHHFNDSHLLTSTHIDPNSRAAMRFFLCGPCVTGGLSVTKGTRGSTEGRPQRKSCYPDSPSSGEAADSSKGWASR